MSGKPLPSVIWFQENQVIDDNFEIAKNKSQVENVLTIENLKRNHLFRIYYCKAMNDFYKSIQSLISLEINCKLIIYSTLNLTFQIILL